jgi:hypothetical protein
MEILFDADDILGALQDLLRQAALLAVVIILLAAAVFFLPCIVSALRDASGKVAVTALNVLCIALIPAMPLLAVIVWLVLLCAAILGSKKVKVHKTPDINIYTGAPQARVYIDRSKKGE